MKSLKEYNLCKREVSCEDCTEKCYCDDWQAFVRLHAQTKSYSHFDKRVSLDMETIRKYVMNPKKVASHSFYPFIHFQKKISRMKNGEPRPNKIRELYYCCHLDRCVYQRYAFLINQYYNRKTLQLEINDVALAYRDNLGKNNIDFAKDAFDYIKKTGQCYIIVGDFSNFFDNLNHIYLKKMLCDLLEVPKLPEDYYAIYKNITHFASFEWNDIVKASGHKITERGIRSLLNKEETILNKKQLKENKELIHIHREKGIPQGSPISAVLSNIYMMEIDVAVNEYAKKLNGKYMRYSDDFLIILPYDVENFSEQKNRFLHIFQNVGKLSLQANKTHTYIFAENIIMDNENNNVAHLDYLGFIFDGKDIKIRPKSLTKYYYRMYRKARTIGRAHLVSPSGKRITGKNLYHTYSSNMKENSQTFIDYAKRARKALTLNDHSLNCLVKRHKHKIHMAIKRADK